MKFLSVVCVLAFFSFSYAYFPYLGGNNQGLSSYTGEPVFVDAMKTARPFGLPNTPCWGNPLNTTYTADGWPKADFGICVFDSGDLPPESEGVWTITWDGPGKCGPSVSAQFVFNLTYNNVTDKSTANMLVNQTNWISGGRAVRLQFTQTQGRVKNVKIIRPGYPVDTNQTFSNWYINSKKGFNTLRLMDLLDTNSVPFSTWETRPQPTDPSFNKGLPYEYCAKLCNEVGANCWVNLPINASSDFFVNAAKLFKQYLNPWLIIYLENSNEVWNYGFPQYRINYDEANNAVAAKTADGQVLVYDNITNPGYIANRNVALRAYKISQAFRSVYGDAAINTNVRVVLAHQVVSSWTFTQGLGMINAVYGPPKNFFFGVAGAPYFGFTKDFTKNVTNTTTIQQILASQQANINSTMSADANLNNFQWSTYYGMEYICYEGGPDTTDATGKNLALQTIINSQSDPALTQMCKDYLLKYWSLGGKLFNWFQIGSGGWSQYGTWGMAPSAATLHTSPKAIALYEILNWTLADIPSPQIGTFLPQIGMNLTTGNGGVWQFFSPPANIINLFNSPTTFGANYTLAFVATANNNQYLSGVNATSVQIWLNNQLLEEVFLNFAKTNQKTNFTLKNPITMNPGLNSLNFISGTSNPNNVKSGRPYNIYTIDIKLQAALTSYPATYNDPPYVYPVPGPSVTSASATSASATSASATSASASSTSQPSGSSTSQPSSSTSQPSGLSTDSISTTAGTVSSGSFIQMSICLIAIAFASL